MKPPLYRDTGEKTHFILLKKPIGYLRSHIRLLFQQYKFLPCKFNNLNKFTDVSRTVVISFLLGIYYFLDSAYLHLQQ